MDNTGDYTGTVSTGRPKKLRLNAHWRAKSSTNIRACTRVCTSGCGAQEREEERREERAVDKERRQRKRRRRHIARVKQYEKEKEYSLACMRGKFVEGILYRVPR